MGWHVTACMRDYAYPRDSIRFMLVLPSPAESLFGEAKVLPALEALFHLSDSKGDDCADPAARTRLLCIPPC